MSICEKVKEIVSQHGKEECCFKDLEEFAISCSERQGINFRERLTVVDPQGAKVGDMVISVEGDDNLSPEILVHIQNRQCISENEYGMSTTSRLKRTLLTVEEVRKEWKVGKDGRQEKQLFIAEMGNYYYVSWKKKILNEVMKGNREIRFEKTKNLVSEGANIVLLRRLAIKRFGGKLYFQAVLIGGQVFDCCYDVTPLSAGLTIMQNERKLPVIKVLRTITVYSNTGIETEKVLCTYLTKDGLIVSHEWNDCPFKVGVDQKARIGFDPVSGTMNRIPLYRSWDQDMELQSLFKDKITSIRASYKSYLLDYPQVRHLISDFMLNLLLVKPASPVQFAIEYFADFKIPSDPETVPSSLNSF